MKRFFLISIIALWGTLTCAYAWAAKETWEIDPMHSRIGFSVRHMMISNVHGEFGKYTCVIKGDPKDVTKAELQVNIDVASINTGVQKRDEHLRSPDFFDVAKFPQMTFKAKKITKTGADTLQIVGSLTLKGVTKDVTLAVTGLTPPTSMMGQMRVGAQATATINREDFGLKYNQIIEAGGVAVGKEVKINIEVELVKKQPAKK